MSQNTNPNDRMNLVEDIYHSSNEINPCEVFMNQQQKLHAATQQLLEILHILAHDGVFSDKEALLSVLRELEVSEYVLWRHDRSISLPSYVQ